MTQPKLSKPQSKKNTLKIIAVVVAFIMWGVTLYMIFHISLSVSMLMELEQSHFGSILRNTDIINAKVTNDEESRQWLKDAYDIDYKKD